MAANEDGSTIPLAFSAFMPSIELVCVQQAKPLEFPDTPFAVVADTSLISHRSPRPLFSRELSQLTGCMYHIGNLDCRDPEQACAYFAYEVLSKESQERQCGRFFEVAPVYREAFRCMLHTLLVASPAHAVFFYTDWQFGPTRSTRGGVISESSFWERHDQHLLKLNACYTIQPNGQQTGCIKRGQSITKPQAISH
ncbi:MAG: hypothetical protein WCO56_21555 [Verrucomicrobiota bacterium]